MIHSLISCQRYNIFILASTELFAVVVVTLVGVGSDPPLGPVVCL